MVSEIAGTTRDTVEATANIGGVIYRFIDTAGLHSTDDVLEQMGIERTTQALAKARIILWLTYNEDSVIEDDLAGYTPTEEQTLYRIVTKIDLQATSAATCHQDACPTIRLSAKTGEGVDLLLSELQAAADATSAYKGDVIISNRRHYDALHQASEALSAAISALQSGISTDLLSEDIRLAIHHLGSITGEITSTEILQSIFSKFCIGK